MNKKITAVIAGLGPRGFHTYGKYQNLFPDRLKVVGIADTDATKVAEAGETLGVAEKGRFPSAEEMFAREKFADVAIIATQDSQHIVHAVMAMEKGYDLLLEKPIANRLGDCFTIMNKSLELNRLVAVCHVLRYTAFYRTVKELIDGGKIGELVHIDANENVGYWHQAHSFVRGNWRNSDESSPMILQKCCHDLDIFNFLTDKKCLSIASYGCNKFFNAAHKPEGSADYCLDCRYKDECVYSAKKIYLSPDSITDREWLCYVVAPHPTPENLAQALRRGPYGRCVFACDNNVVDHQSVNILYEDGVTAHLTMSAFSEKSYRSIRVMGTAGEIDGDQDSNTVRLTEFGKVPVVYDINRIAADLSGHGGGDNAMMTSLLEKLCDGKKDISSSVVNSMQSHVMAFAAEKSRLSGGENISFEQFVRENNKI